MKISELIEKLEKFKEECGDLECYTGKLSENNLSVEIKDIEINSVQFFRDKAIAFIYFD
jgi:hypothetical protein